MQMHVLRLSQFRRVEPILLAGPGRSKITSRAARNWSRGLLASESKTVVAS
jgi:hypothetical protein